MQLDAAGTAVEAPLGLLDRLLVQREPDERDHPALRPLGEGERPVVPGPERGMLVGLVEAEDEAAADAEAVEHRLQLLVASDHAVDVGAEVRVCVEDVDAFRHLCPQLALECCEELACALQRLHLVTVAFASGWSGGAAVRAAWRSRRWASGRRRAGRRPAGGRSTGGRRTRVTGCARSTPASTKGSTGSTPRLLQPHDRDPSVRSRRRGAQSSSSWPRERCATAVSPTTASTRSSVPSPWVRSRCSGTSTARSCARSRLDLKNLRDELRADGGSVTAGALRFALRHPAVTGAIVGVRN